MIIVRFQGRLGNQMFQYGFYRNLISRGKDAYVFLPTEIDWYELGVFDKVNIRFVDKETETRLRRLYASGKFTDRLYRLIATDRNAHYEDEASYDDSLLNVTEGYVHGFFQNEKYFDDVSDELRKTFSFNFPEQNNSIYKEIVQNDYTSIHIRRGDYLNKRNRLIYGNICTDEYYKEAVDIIQRKGFNRFVVFSDDIDWVKSNIKLDNVLFVESGMFDDYQNWYDMFLMTQCRNNIISNSSFSWWGAWLNSNDEKIVIAPKVFDNRFPNRTYAANGWITI